MSTKLFVGNLSFRTTEEALNDLFAADGRQVERVSIVTDRETGRSRGFAFVEMASPDDARSAIDAINGMELDGRALRVDEAREREPRAGGGGFGGGRPGGGRPGGFGGGRPGGDRRGGGGGRPRY